MLLALFVPNRHVGESGFDGGDLHLIGSDSGLGRLSQRGSLASLFFFVGAIILAAVAIFAYKAFKDDDGDTAFIALMISIFLAFPITGGIKFLMELIQIHVAPRIYIIEYLKELG